MKMAGLLSLNTYQSTLVDIRIMIKSQCSSSRRNRTRNADCIAHSTHGTRRLFSWRASRAVKIKALN